MLDADSTASPSSSPVLKSPTGAGRGSSEPSAGTGVEHLCILRVSPTWDEHVARGPVSIRYAVAGLIGEATVELDESARDEFPSAISVTGAPVELHEDLCEIAEAVFVTAWEVGRSGVEAINRARAISWSLRNAEAA